MKEMQNESDIRRMQKAIYHDSLVAARKGDTLAEHVLNKVAESLAWCLGEPNEYMDKWLQQLKDKESQN